MYKLSKNERKLNHFAHFSLFGGNMGIQKLTVHLLIEPLRPKLNQNGFPIDNPRL